MTRFTRVLVAALGVVLLGFMMTLVPQKNVSGAGGAPVIVQNTPLPITGGVNVTNTPLPVNVTNAPLPVSGGVNVTNTPLPITGGVNVSGFVTASVVNDQTSPVFIRDVAGRRAFQTTLNIDNTNPGAGVFCNNSFTCQASFDVPTGPGPTPQRLVVEQVSARIQGAVGQKYLLSLDCATNDTDELFFPYLELSFQGTFLNNTADEFTANQPTRAYCDETTPSPFFTITNNAGSNFFAIVSISGYLIIQP